MHDGDARGAAVHQDAMDFAYGCLEVVYIMKRHERNDEIGTAVVDRQRCGVGAAVIACWIGPSRSIDQFRRCIETDNTMTEALEIARQATFATTDIDGQLSGARKQCKKLIAVKSPI